MIGRMIKSLRHLSRDVRAEIQTARTIRAAVFMTLASFRRTAMTEMAMFANQERGYHKRGGGSGQ